MLTQGFEDLCHHVAATMINALHYSIGSHHKTMTQPMYRLLTLPMSIVQILFLGHRLHGLVMTHQYFLKCHDKMDRIYHQELDHRRSRRLNHQIYHQDFNHRRNRRFNNRLLSLLRQAFHHRVCLLHGCLHNLNNTSQYWTPVWVHLRTLPCSRYR